MGRVTLYSSPSPSAQPPLDQPHYGIGLLAAVRRGFRKYAVFSGRASRSEYWWWILGVSGVYTVLVGLGVGLGLATSTDRGKTPGPAGWPFFILLFVISLAAVIPSIALSVRRLHDSGNSGWLYLLVLIPYVGSIVMIVFGLLATSAAGLRHEPDPTTAILPPGVYPSSFKGPYVPPPTGYAYGATPPAYAPQDQPPPPPTPQPYRPEDGNGR